MESGLQSRSKNHGCYCLWNYRGLYRELVHQHPCVAFPGILMTEESFSDWETDPYKCFLMLSDRDWSMEEMEQDLRDGGLSQASMSGTLEEINSRLTEGSRKLVRNLYTYPKYTAILLQRL